MKNKIKELDVDFIGGQEPIIKEEELQYVETSAIVRHQLPFRLHVNNLALVLNLDFNHFWASVVG